MSVEAAAEAALDYIRGCGGGVTFVELERVVAPHIDPRGDLEILAVPNGIMWTGMSEAFVEVIERIRPFTVPTSTTEWVYMADGKLPNLPIARRLPRDLTRGYAKEYWLPTVLGMRTPQEMGR